MGEFYGLSAGKPRDEGNKSSSGREDSAYLHQNGRLAPVRKTRSEKHHAETPDPLTIGRRLRYYRQKQQRTLAELARPAGISPSALSLIENGHREAKITLLTAFANILGISLADLLSISAPSRRAALEIELERAQREPGYEALGLPIVRVGPRLPQEALEALVGLHRTIGHMNTDLAATPEHARRANTALRQKMRQANNYFSAIEEAAAALCAGVNHEAGPVSRASVDRIAAHLGYKIIHTPELPVATRTVSDLKNRRIFLPPPDNSSHDSRFLALQALAHSVLAHEEPDSYAEFLLQRVEVNYFAAAVLMPEQDVSKRLRQAKMEKDLSIDDLRDAYAVSYETAAHRFTNLATKHLDIPVHFLRVSSDGVIYKAYENDGIVFPSDAVGAIEGQRVCRHWTARMAFEQVDHSRAYQQYTDTPSGTYWCTTFVENTSAGQFSVSVGVPFTQVKWMRGRQTRNRQQSRCPDPTCCRIAPQELSSRWSGNAWPSARAHSHLLGVLPPGTFPGVDDTEVFDFLDRQENA